MATLAPSIRPAFAHSPHPGNGRIALSGLRYAILLILGGVSVASATASRASAQVAVADDAGNIVRLPAPARRIVSLNPVTTELLFALGAGARVVGRSVWCDYPLAARRVPSVGEGFPPNVEAVMARRPDLVILYRTTLNDGAARQLAGLGVPVLQVRTDRLDDVPRVGRLLAAVTGDHVAAESLAQAFDGALAAARSGAGSSGREKPAVLLLAWGQPPVAMGHGSFLGELVDLAGGRNIFDDLKVSSAPVALEAIVVRDPDVVLVVGGLRASFLQRPEWQAVPAVREGRVIALDDAALARPSPRAPEAITALRARLMSIPPHHRRS